MVRKAKSLSFPEPGATKQKEEIVMIDAQRMLAHYNQDHPDLKRPAQRVTQKITNYTGQLAMSVKWAGAAVVKDAITGHTTGMMLLRSRKTTIRPDVIDADEVVPKALK